jgi:hypothetical protein
MTISKCSGVGRAGAADGLDATALRPPDWPQVWSIYGAKRAQPGATRGKRESLENGSNTPIGSRWQPMATVSERMVKVDHLLVREGVDFLASQRDRVPRTRGARRTRPAI